MTVAHQMPSPQGGLDPHFSTTLSFLMRTFAAMLEDLGEHAVARALPWPDIWREETGDGTAPPAGAPPERMAQALSIAFDLLGQAVENAAAQRRRADEDRDALAREPGSLDQCLARLKAEGVPPDTIAATLGALRVEPVLTAHPTEAKRQTVLHHHRTLYRIVVELENSMWTRAERADLHAQARACLERLWRTGEIFLDKPAVADERRNVLHYLTEVFPVALPWLDSRIAGAWARAGLPADLLDGRLPRLGFGNWVGGDRDGHPHVDAAATAETLRLLRAGALGRVAAALDGLGERLSLSALIQPAPPALAAWRDARAVALGDAGAAALARNPDEPWRQAVNLMAAALPHDPAAPGAYPDAAALAADLRRLRASLVAVGAGHLARVDLLPVLRLVETFGFHLAALDIRQNSAFHDRALAGLLVAAGEPEGEEYPRWDTPRRATLIARELASPRPFSAPGAEAGPEAADTVGVLRVAADHAARCGIEGLGAVIVSMTRSAEDLLAVYLFAREAGLMRQGPDGPWIPVPVVPLLETIGDLREGPEILSRYLDTPVVHRSLAMQAQAAGLDAPVQQVMVGYSDSTKDGGLVASFWALYRAQSALAAVGRARGVRIRFFHGRGGAIGRGAGPTHRFLRALPPGVAGGDLRLTEQGETIAQKYANRITAVHHLELLVSGLLGSTLDRREDPADCVAAMDAFSAQALAAWRGLVEAPGFIDFFAGATPIDAIEQARIGSRPARRTGRRTLADLRAIPWTFAWNQARFGLPGWYGFGSAFTALREGHPDLAAALVAAKPEATRWAPLHWLVSNVATAWATACPQTMARYAALVEDEALRARFLDTILAEHARTGAALTAFYGAPPADARPEVHAAIALRDAALKPLHAAQVEGLAAWRSADAADAEERLRPVLLMVNAIASGLGGTG